MKKKRSIKVQGVRGKNRVDAPEQAVSVLRTRVDVYSVSLFVLAVLAVVFALHWARAVFIPMMLGVMISYALTSPVNLMQKWHIPRAIGAAVLLLAIVGGTGSAVSSLSDDAGELIETLPEAAQAPPGAAQERERPKARWSKCKKPHPTRAGSERDRCPGTRHAERRNAGADRNAQT